MPPQPALEPSSSSEGFISAGEIRRQRERAAAAAVRTSDIEELEALLGGFPSMLDEFPSVAWALIERFAHWTIGVDDYEPLEEGSVKEPCCVRVQTLVVLTDFVQFIDLIPPEILHMDLRPVAAAASAAASEDEEWPPGVPDHGVFLTFTKCAETLEPSRLPQSLFRASLRALRDAHQAVPAWRAPPSDRTHRATATVWRCVSALSAGLLGTPTVLCLRGAPTRTRLDQLDEFMECNDYVASDAFFVRGTPLCLAVTSLPALAGLDSDPGQWSAEPFMQCVGGIAARGGRALVEASFGVYQNAAYGPSNLLAALARRSALDYLLYVLERLPEDFVRCDLPAAATLDLLYELVTHLSRWWHCLAEARAVKASGKKAQPSTPLPSPLLPSLSFSSLKNSGGKARRRKEKEKRTPFPARLCGNRCSGPLAVSWEAFGGKVRYPVVSPPSSNRFAEGRLEVASAAVTQALAIKNRAERAAFMAPALATFVRLSMSRYPVGLEPLTDILEFFPDEAFLCDVPPEEALARASTRCGFVDRSRGSKGGGGVFACSSGSSGSSGDEDLLRSVLSPRSQRIFAWEEGKTRDYVGGGGSALKKRRQAESKKAEVQEKESLSDLMGRVFCATRPPPRYNSIPALACGTQASDFPEAVAPGRAWALRCVMARMGTDNLRASFIACPRSTPLHWAARMGAADAAWTLVDQLGEKERPLWDVAGYNELRPCAAWGCAGEPRDERKAKKRRKRKAKGSGVRRSLSPIMDGRRPRKVINRISSVTHSAITPIRRFSSSSVQAANASEDVAIFRSSSVPSETTIGGTGRGRSPREEVCAYEDEHLLRPYHMLMCASEAIRAAEAAKLNSSRDASTSASHSSAPYPRSPRGAAKALRLKLKAKGGRSEAEAPCSRQFTFALLALANTSGSDSPRP